MLACVAFSRIPTFFSKRLISTSRTLHGPKIVYFDHFPRLKYVPFEEQAKKFGEVKGVSEPESSDRFVNVEFESESSAANFHSYIQTEGLVGDNRAGKRRNVIPRSLLVDTMQATKMPIGSTTQLSLSGFTDTKRWAPMLKSKDGWLDGMAFVKVPRDIEGDGRIYLQFHTENDASNALQFLSNAYSNKYPERRIEYADGRSGRPPRKPSDIIYIPYLGEMKTRIQEALQGKSGIEQVKYRPLREYHWRATIQCADIETAKRIKAELEEQFYVDYLTNKQPTTASA